jgi:hypothetical protein
MRAVVLAALAITSIAAALLGVGALLVTGLVSHMMAQTGQFHGIVFTPSANQKPLRQEHHPYHDLFVAMLPVDSKAVVDVPTRYRTKKTIIGQHP